MKARTQAANQIHAIIEAAPPTLREPLRGLSLAKLISVARRLRWRGPLTPLSAAKLTLKGLAERWAGLDAEIRHLDDQLESLVEDAAPRLIALRGVAPKLVELFWSLSATTRIGCGVRPLSPHCAEPALLTHHPDVSNAIA